MHLAPADARCLPDVEHGKERKQIFDINDTVIVEVAEKVTPWRRLAAVRGKAGFGGADGCGRHLRRIGVLGRAVEVGAAGRAVDGGADLLGRRLLRGAGGLVSDHAVVAGQAGDGPSDRAGVRAVAETQLPKVAHTKLLIKVNIPREGDGVARLRSHRALDDRVAFVAGAAVASRVHGASAGDSGAGAGAGTGGEIAGDRGHPPRPQIGASRNRKSPPHSLRT